MKFLVISVFFFEFHAWFGINVDNKYVDICIAQAWRKQIITRKIDHWIRNHIDVSDALQKRTVTVEIFWKQDWKKWYLIVAPLSLVNCLFPSFYSFVFWVNSIARAHNFSTRENLAVTRSDRVGFSFVLIIQLHGYDACIKCVHSHLSVSNNDLKREIGTLVSRDAVYRLRDHCKIR